MTNSFLVMAGVVVSTASLSVAVVPYAAVTLTDDTHVVGRTWGTNTGYRGATSSDTVMNISWTAAQVATTSGSTGVTGDTRSATSREEAVMRQLDRIGALADGWHGDGSNAPSAETVSRFVSLSEQVAGLPTSKSLAPTVDGGILLEWVTEGTEYTAELESDGSLFMSIAGPGDEAEIEIPFDGNVLKNFIVLGRWSE
jgi:hypothetical protein